METGAAVAAAAVTACVLAVRAHGRLAREVREVREAREAQEARGDRGARGARGGPVLSEYEPPSWLTRHPACASLRVPGHRLHALANLPTPLDFWFSQGNAEIWIKRDDFTGSECSGNKIRKLEFLLAEALHSNFDTVITIGGIQSNHCRATAAAAARVGLKAHLILRTLGDTSKDPGFAGNLLVSRLVGAKLHLVSPEVYHNHANGSFGLCEDLTEQLAQQGERAFPFPSGGSNALGVFGYLEAVEELQKQIQSQGVQPFDRIYFACGSGGTAAGLALGLYCSSRPAGSELVAVGVDDNPDFFYNKIDSLWRDMGVQLPDGKTSRDLIRIEQGVGAGYANSTPQELEQIARIARTGILLDPVYSGKAVLGMLRDLEGNVDKPLRVLFIHTGGMLGMFDKIDALARLPSLSLS